MADVETAIRWVKGHATEYHLDLGRTALLGESAGGHLVSLVGARMEQEGTTKLPAVVSNTHSPGTSCSFSRGAC